MQLDQRTLIAATAVLALAVPVVAGAQSHDIGMNHERGPYVGTLVGYSSIDVGLSEWNNALYKLPVPSGSSITSTSVNKGDFAWSLNLGYLMTRH